MDSSVLPLFRAFRIAVGLRKLLLAAAGLLLLIAGNRLMLNLPFAPDSAAAEVWPWNERPIRFDGEWTAEKLLNESRSVAGLLLRPAESLLEPAAKLFAWKISWPGLAFAWSRLLWALVVWSLVAGGLTRMAAVQLARDERLTLLDGVRFAGSRFLSYLGAPLMPLLGALAFWGLGLLAGYLGRMPVVGEAILGIGWIVPLLFALAMTMILLGLAVGWPLMFAAISTEGSDAFDGFSRGYNYVYSHPWRYSGYGLAAMLYGVVVFAFVVLVVLAVVYLAGRSVASGLGPEATTGLLGIEPQWPPSLTNQGASADSVGTLAARGWLKVAAVVPAAFAVSYFWTAATVIYFLLRRDEDGTEMGEVYLPQPEPTETNSALPLVGAAARNAAQQQGPARQQGDDSSTA